VPYLNASEVMIHEEALYQFSLSAVTLLAGRREGHLACKKVGC